MKRAAGGFSLLELLLATTIAAGLFALLWTLLRPVSGEQRAIEFAGNIQALAENIRAQWQHPAAQQSNQLTQPRYRFISNAELLAQGLVPAGLVRDAASNQLATPWGGPVTVSLAPFGGGPIGTAARITVNLFEADGRDRTYCSTLFNTLLPRVDFARITESGEEVGLTVANAPTPQRIQTLVTNNCARAGALTLEIIVQ